MAGVIQWLCLSQSISKLISPFFSFSFCQTCECSQRRVRLYLVSEDWDVVVEIFTWGCHKSLGIRRSVNDLSCLEFHRLYLDTTGGWGLMAGSPGKYRQYESTGGVSHLAVWQRCVRLTALYLSDINVSVWHHCPSGTTVSVWLRYLSETPVAVWQPCARLTMLYPSDRALSVGHYCICLTLPCLFNSTVSVWQPCVRLAAL